VHDLHRPFVMTAKLRGGDDGNRQNLGVGDLRPHITALPQAFHQRVDHDNSRYHPIGVHRLLLAMMVVWQPRSCQSCRWSSTGNQGILDSVWTDYRFSATEVVADNASGGGFLLGERLLEQIPDGDLSLYLNGELRTSGPIAALGNIEQQLCWLAQTVGELKAGQIVFLGSPAQAIPAVAGVVEVVCGSSILQVQLTGVV